MPLPMKTKQTARKSTGGQMQRHSPVINLVSSDDEDLCGNDLRMNAKMQCAPAQVAPASSNISAGQSITIKLPKQGELLVLMQQNAMQLQQAIEQINELAKSVKELKEEAMKPASAWNSSDWGNDNWGNADHKNSGGKRE